MNFKVKTQKFVDIRMDEEQAQALRQALIDQPEDNRESCLDDLREGLDKHFGPRDPNAPKPGRKSNSQQAAAAEAASEAAAEAASEPAKEPAAKEPAPAKEPKASEPAPAAAASAGGKVSLKPAGAAK